MRCTCSPRTQFSSSLAGFLAHHSLGGLHPEQLWFYRRALRLHQANHSFEWPWKLRARMSHTKPCRHAPKAMATHARSAGVSELLRRTGPGAEQLSSERSSCKYSADSHGPPSGITSLGTRPEIPPNPNPQERVQVPNPRTAGVVENLECYHTLKVSLRQFEESPIWKALHGPITIQPRKNRVQKKNHHGAVPVGDPTSCKVPPAAGSARAHRNPKPFWALSPEM